MAKCPRQLFPKIGQSVLAIINSSLSSGAVPANSKHAVVQPIIKKPGLNQTVLVNFKLVSNLPFLSLFLEDCLYIVEVFFEKAWHPGSFSIQI